MNKYKGVVEIEILGKQRGFKFGTASMAMLCELENAKLNEVVARLDDITNNINTAINFYYSAAVAYVRLNNSETESKIVEPTREQVANWMDSLAAETKQKIESDAFATYSSPNVTAPETAGQ